MGIIGILISIVLINPIYAQYGTSTYSLLNRPTNQSSVYTGHLSGEEGINGTSDKAVDENTGNVFGEGACTHTKTERIAWWVVDMEENVTEYSVTITNRLIGRFHTRLNSFSILGVNALHYSEAEGQTCLVFDQQFGNGVTRTLKCDTPITTRFLAIVIFGRMEILTLCDVQIRAVCRDGNFGVNCSGRCSENCKNPPCDKFTQYGECANGECFDGYVGLNCTQECPVGKYGQNCENTCPLNCQNLCSTATGKCNGGCKRGYTGDTCEKDSTIVALAVPLAITSVLCIGLIVYILFSKIRSNKSAVNERANMNSTSLEAAYVNAHIDTNEAHINDAARNDDEQRTYEQLANNNLDDGVQTYQDLQV